MRKQLIAVPLICGALLSLVACGDYSIPESTPPPSQSADANPFEAVEDESGFLATLTHGAASPDLRMTAASFSLRISILLPASWMPLDFSCFWMANRSPTK